MTGKAVVEPIVIELVTTADPAAAWRTLTDPEEVAEWFADVTPVDGIGSPYRIDFGDGSAVEGRVRALDPGRRLAYSWTWAGDAKEPTTLVTWEVEPADGGARIRLTHDGWAEAGADVETRNDHADYWETYFEDLQELLEDEGRE